MSYTHGKLLYEVQVLLASSSHQLQLCCLRECELFRGLSIQNSSWQPCRAECLASCVCAPLGRG